MKNNKVISNNPLTCNKKADTDILLAYNIPVLIEEMKNNNDWTNTGYNEMVLISKPCEKIVLTALKKGGEIKSFQSNVSITFHIIEGKLRIKTKKESILLDKGQLLTIQENIKYKLTIKTETVLLLTIAFGII